jgi:hypothetical protein
MNDMEVVMGKVVADVINEAMLATRGDTQCTKPHTAPVTRYLEIRSGIVVDSYYMRRKPVYEVVKAGKVFNSRKDVNEFMAQFIVDMCL